MLTFSLGCSVKIEVGIVLKSVKYNKPTMKNDFSSEISLYSLPLPCAAHEAVRDLWVSRVQVLNSVVNVKLPAILPH